MREGVKSSTQADLAFARIVRGEVTLMELMLAVSPITSLENLPMNLGALLLEAEAEAEAEEEEGIRDDSREDEEEEDEDNSPAVSEDESTDMAAELGKRPLVESMVVEEERDGEEEEEEADKREVREGSSRRDWWGCCAVSIRIPCGVQQSPDPSSFAKTASSEVSMLSMLDS